MNIICSLDCVPPTKLTNHYPPPPHGGRERKRGGVGYTHLEVAGQGEEVSSSLHWARMPERREYQHTVQVLYGSACRKQDKALHPTVSRQFLIKNLNMSCTHAISSVVC